MWAVRQSPYHNPDGLSEVLETFRKSALASGVFDSNEMAQMNGLNVTSFLKFHLWPIPQFQKWNERKNGNQSPYAFVNRYSRPNPDNDFIDLDALTRNVVMNMFRELNRDHDFDEEFDRQWKRDWLKRWWYGVKQKLFPIRPSDPQMNTPTQS